MAHTVTFYSGGVSYTPTFRILAYTPTGGPGMTSVTETVQIQTTKASLITLQQVIDRAHRRTTYGEDYSVWARITLDGGTEYETEILGGQIEYDEGALSRAQWSTDKIICSIIWTRRNWWERTANDSLTIKDLAGNTETSPVTLAVYPGVGNGNGLQVFSASGRYDMPSPARLEITGLNGKNIIVTSARRGAQVLLEGEDGTAGANVISATPTVSAACSGGDYNAVVVAADAVNWKELLSWSTSGMTQGVWYLPVVRTLTSTAGVAASLRLVLREGSAAGAVVFTSGAVSITGDTYTHALPPVIDRRIADYLNGTVTPLYVSLEIFYASGSNLTVSLDCLYLLPMDSGRVYRSFASTAQKLIDDSRMVYAYKTSATTGYSLSHVPAGDNVLLFQQDASNQLGRVYFLPDFTADDSAVTFTVTLTARERRYTL